MKIYRNIVLGEPTNETVTQPKSQNLKPKKDLFRPYCLKDPDIKPFKLQCNYKVRFIHNVGHRYFDFTKLFSLHFIMLFSRIFTIYSSPLILVHCKDSHFYPKDTIFPPPSSKKNQFWTNLLLNLLLLNHQLQPLPHLLGHLRLHLLILSSIKVQKFEVCYKELYIWLGLFLFCPHLKVYMYMLLCWLIISCLFKARIQMLACVWLTLDILHSRSGWVNFDNLGFRRWGLNQPC